MTIEVAILISGLSLAFAIYQGIANIRRNQKADDKNEASQLTTVIVKLDHIVTCVTEIKTELTGVKHEVKEDHERIVKLEARMNNCEKFCKMSTIENDK